MRTTTETIEPEHGYPSACPEWFGPLMFTAAIFIIITAVSMLLSGCATWSNASRPGATYTTDHRECMNEIGLVTVGKPYGQRLDDCVAAKGWVRQ